MARVYQYVKDEFWPLVEDAVNEHRNVGGGVLESDPEHGKTSVQGAQACDGQARQGPPWSERGHGSGLGP